MSKRYLLARTISARPLSTAQLEVAVTTSVRRLFGAFGLARIYPKVLRFDSANALAIISCNGEGAEDLQAAIALISDAAEAKVAVVTIRVSGTIKGLRTKQHF